MVECPGRKRGKKIKQTETTKTKERKRDRAIAGRKEELHPWWLCFFTWAGQESVQKA